MAGIRIEGNTSAHVAEVDSSNNLNVVLPLSSSQAGFAVLAGELSAPSEPQGSIRKRIFTSAEGRLHVATDRPVLYINFAGSATSANAIPQDALKQTATTMTATAGSPNNGFLRLNASAITTVTTGIAYQSYATFPAFAGFGTRYEWEARVINANSAAGKVIELGAGYITSATSVGLLDGFCLRWTGAGEFRGVLSINGVETTTAALAIPSDNVVHRFTIVQAQDGLYFFVDGVLQAVLSAPTDSVGPGFQNNPPILMRVYNNVAPSLAAQLEVAELWVLQGGIDWNKPWPHVASGMGQHASNVPLGTAVGETTNGANGTAVPATAVGTNTGATLPMATLGGIGRMTAQATNIAAAGDMVFCSYAVPVATATQGSKRLHITGIMISCSNGGAAVATTPTTLLWGLAWGHTALSLATADAVGAKAPRHMKLGMMTAATAVGVGGMYDRDIVRAFSTPIVVNPGEFIATTVRFLIGTATASQEVVASIGFEGYWE